MPSGETRFAELYDRFYGDVWRYCSRRTTPDNVDDAVADTFLTAWRKIDQLPSGDEALPWLYSVAYRTIGHHYRSSRRRRRLHEKLNALGVDLQIDTEEIVVLDHESRQVHRALETLRASDQEILRLNAWEELTVGDIATVLDIEPEAAKKRLSRARLALSRSYDRLEKRMKTIPAAQKGGAF